MARHAAPRQGYQRNEISTCSSPQLGWQGVSAEPRTHPRALAVRFTDMLPSVRLGPTLVGGCHDRPVSTATRTADMRWFARQHL
jgi:hypothetical protein